MDKKRFLGKWLIKISILLILIGSRSFFQELLISALSAHGEVELESKNNYYLTYTYSYIKNVDNFEPQNKTDLLNLYYTVINSGVDEFSFYCPKEYKKCLDDVVELAENQNELSDINGFVHPFNSFDTIETTYDSLRKVQLKIVKTYTDKEIEEINKKVDEIIKNVVKEEKDTKKVIQLIHDYIIEHTKYDKDRADFNKVNYASNTAYGVLFEGYGVCNGYADAMSIFLNRYNIPNYKIASANHIWNAVNLDGKWYHLDLTWDDPITKDNKDVILHDYFLITSNKLKTLDVTQHTFNMETYVEMKSED